MKNDYKTFVNISTREFEAKQYNETNPKAYSYKPDTGFWGAIKVGNDYFSEWDREYGLDDPRRKNGNLYITTFSFDPETTYIMRPEEDELILEGFANVIKSNPEPLTVQQKRQLLAEYIKDKKGLPNVKHVVCQIDEDMDMMQIERIFGGFDREKENSDEVFENLGYQVRKAFIENFSAVEVTANAIDEEHPMEFDIIHFAYMTQREFPKYNPQPGFWDVPSVAVFDTDAIDIMDVKVLTDKQIKEIEAKREEEEREEEER